MTNQKNPNKRYIGKIKNIQTQNGLMQRILIDNVNNLNPDGTPNQYYKGSLVWVDAATGQQFVIKGLSIGNASQRDQGNGFVASISFVLDNDYDVIK